ncbi:PAS domain-containing protein [Sagittula stellata]|uniref:Methyl-accepting chemotaxis protein n=1 Tax=Sagittula stellata (strain ATCC 700073 / DSM 11524 / E-37) TaxID=388399 RepID=A3K3Q3_SAGS3|nr:PAS domain-containing protein [Sagittula stellata]EBA08167.1 methyl-accepting chemotaxis protein [Sagittula stellata E-37]
MTDQTTRFIADSSYAGSEAQFHLSELFYSRTDQRGVIQAGNTVFQRVAGYDWDELIGAPHKLVRHPDMPKGVFELIWRRLAQGKPTGGYVKNRCKNGRYYWVFALIAPIEGGYVSTRLKPASPLRGTVEQIYKALLAREREEGLKPSASADALLETLKKAGYSSYDAFQSHAMATEAETRAQQMGRQLDPLQRRFLDMSRAITQVHVETTEMTEAFKAIRTVPMNMRIIASRLENAGGPISAISVNYSQMLEEMSTWVDTFVDGDACVFARIRDAIFKGQFLGFATQVEREMIGIFEEEREKHRDAYPSNVSTETEAARCDEVRNSFLEATAESLGDVEAEAKRFARSVLDMKRYVTGLSSTRMMCKIESAALNNSGTALSGIVEQLDACQDEIERRLARVVELNSVIQGNTAMLRSLI